MNILKKLISSALAVSLLLGVTVAVPATAGATAYTVAQFSGAKDAACGGADLSGSSTGCGGTDSESTINRTIRTALNIISVVVGVMAVFMLIFAGIKFITSQGESAGVASARNTIIYALVGLVVVLLSQFIVQFVLKTAIDGTPQQQAEQGVENGVDGVTPGSGD